MREKYFCRWCVLYFPLQFGIEISQKLSSFDEEIEMHLAVDSPSSLLPLSMTESMYYRFSIIIIIAVLIFIVHFYHSLPYETFDILSDEEVRQGLKTYSDWPTYPQVYVKGELIGGLDIIKELQANNELEANPSEPGENTGLIKISSHYT